MPVLLAGGKPHHVAGPNFFDRAAPTLRPAATACDNQRLAERMRVPRGACAGFKRDTDTGCACWGVRCAEDQALVSRGMTLTVAERARAVTIGLRYGLPLYFAR